MVAWIILIMLKYLKYIQVHNLYSFIMMINITSFHNVSSHQAILTLIQHHVENSFLLSKLIWHRTNVNFSTFYVEPQNSVKKSTLKNLCQIDVTISMCLQGYNKYINILLCHSFTAGYTTRFTILQMVIRKGNQLNVSWSAICGPNCGQILLSTRGVTATEEETHQW